MLNMSRPDQILSNLLQTFLKYYREVNSVNRSASWTVNFSLKFPIMANMYRQDDLVSSLFHPWLSKPNLLKSSRSLSRHSQSIISSSSMAAFFSLSGSSHTLARFDPDSTRSKMNIMRSKTSLLRSKRQKIQPLPIQIQHQPIKIFQPINISQPIKI
jgi:hypothetical protein